jgi:hypothetical protein
MAQAGVQCGGGTMKSCERDLVPDPNPANLKRLTTVLEDLDATMPTVEGRPFDPSKDGAVVLPGGNVTADTKFGGLGVVQKLRGCRRIPSLPRTRSRATCWASLYGCAHSAGCER